MSTPRTPTQASDAIVFHRTIAPLAVFFVAVPAITLVAIGIAIFLNVFPIPLLVLLAVVGGSCMFWIKVALPQIGSVTVDLTAAELRINRMFGGVSYPWSHIEAIKLVDPGSTLADSGRHEDGRVGIALFLRSTAKDRKPDSPPDEIVVTGNQDSADAIITGCERMVAYQRRSSGGERGSQGGFGRNGKSFRKPAKAASTAA